MHRPSLHLNQADVEPEVQSKASIHLDHLDGLRAVAALFVVVHHTLTYTNLSALSASFWPGHLLGVFAYGSYAVDLFIVLSGFCLMLPVVRGSSRKATGNLVFFWRRARRILPTYYCAMLLSIIMVMLLLHEKTGSIWDSSIPITLKSIVMHLLLLHDIFGETHTVNYVLWSIAVEWRIYFFFPLLVLSWRRLGAEVTVAFALATSFALYVLCFVLIHATLSAHYIGLFSLGMLAASISFTSSHAWARSLNWNWITIGAFLLVVMVSTCRFYRGQLVPPFIADYFVGVFSAATLVLVSTHALHPVHLVLSWRPVVFLGTFAYSIYLIHAPLLQITWQAIPFLHLPPWLTFAGLVVVGWPIIILGSYLFFLLCERPFLQKHFERPYITP